MREGRKEGKRKGKNEEGRWRSSDMEIRGGGKERLPGGELEIMQVVFCC